MISLRPFDQDVYGKNKAATKKVAALFLKVLIYLTVILKLKLQKVFELAFRLQVVL